MIIKVSMRGIVDVIISINVDNLVLSAMMTKIPPNSLQSHTLYFFKIGYARSYKDK